MADYIEYLRAYRKNADDAAIKLNTYVVPILGAKRVAEQTPADLDEWMMAALKRQQRRKPKKPRPEPKRRRKAKAAPAEDDGAGRAHSTDPDEQRRRRKSTLNRVITALKATLNHAYDRQKVATRDAWAKLKKFKGVDAARLRWLAETEAKRLMNAATADMRRLIQGGLMTGCRQGELARARARDFDSTSETLLVPDSKTGTPRRVPLTVEGGGLLESWTSGMQSDDLIFTRADGSPWNCVAVIRGMQAASDAAQIAPRSFISSPT